MNNDDRRRHGSPRRGGPEDFDDSFQDQRDRPGESRNQPRQYGQGSEYGRSHEREYRRSGFSGDFDRSDDYGRGDERIRDEGHGHHRNPGVHATEQGERLRSRSADPGQSSYGGFANEDPGFQRQQGVYKRIPPKGYTRSDERIHEDVCERLSHSGLDVSEVSVNVAEGKVTLEGTVKNRRVKHAIEDCADDCAGVVDIDNRITVQRDHTGPSGQ